MEEKKKFKILLCWWYDRKDLIEPFFALEDIEFVLLFYRFKAQEALHFELPFKRLYWTDFSSPYAILRTVRPDRIVFMGIENLLTISLNIAAHAKGIKTIYLAHGVTYSLKNARMSKNPAIELIPNYNTKNLFYQKKKIHSLLFYFQCLRFKSFVALPFLVRYLITCLLQRDIQLRLAYCKSKFRLADKYVLYAPAYSRLFRERDGVNDDRLSYTGPYSMDHLFRALKLSEGEKKGYWLFIDQPLDSIDWEKRVQVFSVLAKAASDKYVRLRIKLHPLDFQKPPPLIEGVDFVKDEEDLISLIRNASLCIGYFSSLLIPVIVFKEVVVIDLGGIDLIAAWSKTNAIHCIPITTLLSGSSDWSLLKKELQKDGYIRDFVSYTDGHGLSRARTALVNN